MSLISFSGGCDSTVLLYNWAETSSLTYPVHALSISHEGVPNLVQQKKARKKIIANLRARGFHIKHTELSITINQSEFWFEQGTGVSQPVMWVPSAVQCLKADENLLMGYIRSDDIMHYRKDLFDLFDTSQRLIGKTGKLELPLEWTPKTEIIKRLRDIKLYDLVWYCEGNTTSPIPCGHCSSCTKHRLALYELDELSKTSPANPTSGIPTRTRSKAKKSR